MTDLLEAAPSPPVRPNRRPAFRIFATAFRAVATLHAAAALTQPVSIGRYLGGVYGWLGVHAGGADVVLLLGFLLGLTGLGYAIAGGRVWVGAICPVFFFAEGLQIGMGYARNLAVHVPLGVLIVVGAVLIMVWAWTPAAARSRGRR